MKEKFPPSQHYRIEIHVARGPVEKGDRQTFNWTQGIEWGPTACTTFVVDGVLLALLGRNGSKEQRGYIAGEIAFAWDTMFDHFYPRPSQEAITAHLKEKGFTEEDARIGLAGLASGQETPIAKTRKEFIDDWKARRP